MNTSSKITLRFGGLAAAYDETLPLAGGYRIAGNFIRDLSSGQVLASYHNHQWQVGDRHFASYVCREPCKIYFEDLLGGATPPFGPFKAILVADGTLYADQVLFAKFIDETTNWHSYALETYWATLIIRAV